MHRSVAGSRSRERTVPSIARSLDGSTEHFMAHPRSRPHGPDDAVLTTPVQGSAIREDRSSHPRLAGLRRAASLRLGKGASFGLGQARVPTDAPLSLHRANERRLPRQRQGSHRAARLRRAWRTLEHAMADDPRGEGKGPVGGERLRSVGDLSPRRLAYLRRSLTR